MDSMTLRSSAVIVVGRGRAGETLPGAGGDVEDVRVVGIGDGGPIGVIGVIGGGEMDA